jgi:molecular chaperone GrpE
MSEETKINTEETGADHAAEKSEQEKSEQEEKLNSLESMIADLRQQLAAKEIEAKNNFDRLLRQAAELENYKKRSARERDDAARYANEMLLKDLLPVVDNLERAVAHAAGGGNGKPLVEGVEMVLRSLLDTLAKHGVSQMIALGQPFDPAKHEAIAQVESEDHEPNSIVEELHKGYLLRERLLRPALVSVAKGAKTQEKKNQESKVENEPIDD